MIRGRDGDEEDRSIAGEERRRANERKERNETNLKVNWNGTRPYCLLEWKVPQIDNGDGSWYCK